MSVLSDEKFLELAEPFGAFEYGDAQGDKRIAYGRAVAEAAVAADREACAKVCDERAERIEQRIAKRGPHAGGVGSSYLEVTAVFQDAGAASALRRAADAIRDTPAADRAARAEPVGEVIYRWRALDCSGYVYGSNPPKDLPERACLTPFIRATATDADDDGAFQAQYRIPDGEWSSWGHVVCGVKGHEMRLRYLAPSAPPAAPVVPEGWPTPEMEDAGFKAMMEAETDDDGLLMFSAVGEIFRAMLAATPAPSQEPT